MAETLNSATVSTQQQRIAELASQSPRMAFTSLNHPIDLAWLREAYHRTRKDGAVGVDGQTGGGWILEVDIRKFLETSPYYTPVHEGWLKSSG